LGSFVGLGFLSVTHLFITFSTRCFDFDSKSRHPEIEAKKKKKKKKEKNGSTRALINPSDLCGGPELLKSAKAQ